MAELQLSGLTADGVQDALWGRNAEPDHNREHRCKHTGCWHRTAHIAACPCRFILQTPCLSTFAVCDCSILNLLLWGGYWGAFPGLQVLHNPATVLKLLFVRVPAELPCAQVLAAVVAQLKLLLCAGRRGAHLAAGTQAEKEGALVQGAGRVCAHRAQVPSSDCCGCAGCALGQ